MTATTVLVLLAFVPAVAFPLIYGLMFPWWRNPVGWSMLNLSAVIALSLSLSVWRVFVGSPAPGPLRLVIYGLIVLALWAQLIVLLLSPWWNRQRLSRQRRPAQSSDDSVHA